MLQNSTLIRLHILNMKTVIFVWFSALLSGVFCSPTQHSSENSKIWAVLAAGSDGYGNYRHQADVCHAYQVLHNHGVPDERIVVMMVDDIAYNRRNPTPGVIFNHPNGPNVYQGVPHDYTGGDVNPQNFMAVLRGDKEALKGIGSGKVLESGPNDHVFVYFSDHGAPGIICFPYSELSARDLNKTIWDMYNNRKYEEMVIYVETCHSGSMFENILPNNINVFATTAANPSESSYACYWDGYRRAYLGDSYSVNWMEDSDKKNLSLESLKTQFEIVKRKTTGSHVQKYGDESVSTLALSEFQGKQDAPPITYTGTSNDYVRSRDADLEALKQKISSAGTPDERHQWERELEKMTRSRQFLSDKVRAVVDNLATEDPSISNLWDAQLKVKNFDCYDEVRKYFNEECFAISKNQYALEFMQILVNLCEHGVAPAKQKQAMQQVCTHPPTCRIV